MTDTKTDPGRSRRPALLLLPLGLIGVSICAVSLFANVTLGEAESFIAAPLHSAALANYAQDPIGGRLQSLSIRIIEFAIQDREPETDDAGARATDVVESLKSPVPTVTPRPGDSTYTPTAPSTSVPSPTIGNTGTQTPTPSPTRTPTRTPTSTPTDPATAGPSLTPTKTPTLGPSPTATKTPTPGPSSTPTPCAPVITIVAPLDGATHTLAGELPGQAIAYDPDNVDPDCSPATPPPDGTGILQVDFEIKSEASGWSVVHYEDQFSVAYCAFQGAAICNKHSLSSGEWPPLVPTPPPTPEPIELGWHKLYARAKDDEGIWSSWVFVDFYIIAVPTATPTRTPTPTLTPTPTPTRTPTPSATATVTATSTPTCFLTAFSGASNDVRWTLTNGTTSGTIDQIDLVWNFSAGLDKIKLDIADIWDGYINPSPASISSGWTPESRFFNASDAKELRFQFDNSVGGHTFTVTVYFNNGCDVTRTDGA